MSTVYHKHNCPLISSRSGTPSIASTYQTQQCNRTHFGGKFSCVHQL